MNEPTLRQMMYFLAVLDQGSLTAAARHSHISQSALSMAVNQLESFLKVQLFIRQKSQKALPTPAALRLEPHARAMLDRLDMARLAVHDEHHDLQGTLRVGCLSTLSPRILPRLVHQISQEFPGIVLRLQESSPVNLQEQLRLGRLDLVFMYRRMMDNDLDCVDLLPAEMHVMLPGNHELAASARVSVRDLGNLPLILLDIPPTADSILGILAALGLNPVPRLRSPNIETVREYVGLGLGYCLTNTIPENTLSFGNHPVAYVPLADSIQANSISAVRLPDLAPSRRVQLAIDLVRRNLSRSAP